MSFNNQHIILDRLNYQEAFLLYVDGELSAVQMDAVEAFVALHPDLQEELDALLYHEQLQKANEEYYIQAVACVT